MTDKDKVRSVVARFFNVSEATVTETFAFPPERLHGSVGRSTFYAAIKRMAGADLATAFSATTFGELFDPAPVGAKTEQVPTAEAGSRTAVAPARKPSASNSAVGIDIEHVDDLPKAEDPWSEAFYVEHFTRAEIAYCQRQASPRESFCGLWCAKEAVMKCGEEFLKLRPIEMEIGHDERGRPFLIVLRDGKDEVRSDCVISISHAHGLSVAVCVKNG